MRLNKAFFISGREIHYSRGIVHEDQLSIIEMQSRGSAEVHLNTVLHLETDRQQEKTDMVRFQCIFYTISLKLKYFCQFFLCLFHISLLCHCLSLLTAVSFATSMSSCSSWRERENTELQIFVNYPFRSNLFFSHCLFS